MKTGLQTAGTTLIGLAVFGMCLFLPAGTFDYWQAWAFIVVFTIATMIPSLYLRAKDPAALERRMQAGPMAESRPLQKVLITIAFLSLPGVMVFSAFDYRFGWSTVPAVVSVIGDVLVAGGLVLAQFVVFQNSYAAANIKVEVGQTVVSTGLYGLVRHPMYFGTLVMAVGIPLALGSWLGLWILVPCVVVLVLRILDEEQVLERELEGYGDYEQKVHFRLVPRVW